MHADRVVQDEHRRSRVGDALLLAAGAPLALAGHWTGRQLAEGAWQMPDPLEPWQVQTWVLTGAAFALAAAVHLVGPLVQRKGRRLAAGLRSDARRRWGEGRPPREFARAYRAAGWACGFAAALLVCALLAALGIEPIDQSVAVIATLAVAMFARLVLRVFAALRFHPLACLGTAFALWAGAGWLGIL